MKNKKSYLIIAILIIIIAIILYFVLNTKKEITFSINDSKLTLKVNEEKKINYSISDSNLKINWITSNPNIATVDNGIVKGKSVGSVIITATVDDKSITCLVTVQAENYDITLLDISLPSGEILLTVSSTYLIPITYIPNNGYIDNIQYIPEDNSIISVEDGIITALKPGYTTLKIIVNNIEKEINVNVTNNNVSNNIITPVNEVIVNQEEIIYVNDTKELTYSITPSNGNIFDIKWNNSNNEVISIDDNGVIKGLKSGEAIVSLLINNKIRQSIKITVKNKLDKIELNYSPKEILKVGDTFKLEPTIIPTDSQAKIIYESNNKNILNVTSDGIVTAINKGNAIITMKSDDGTITKSLSFTILDNKGVLNTDKVIWSYSKNTDVTPKKADNSFFSQLARNGRGTISNGIYIYQKYSYDINNNLLTINNKNKIYMRIYYPENRDLSSLNTFTFIGGVGEANFGGLFYSLDKDPSQMKTSGILIFIPESDRAKVYGANVAEATNFVKLIINQNPNARNSVGGYSNGGPPCGDAIKNGNYNRVMIIDSSFYWVDTIPNAKNPEYVIYSPQGDSWRGTDSFIKELYNFGVKNVTVVSNNSSIIDKFRDKYLVINPGSSMQNGHTSKNLILSHMFSYGVE